MREGKSTLRGWLLLREHVICDVDVYMKGKEKIASFHDH